MSDNIRRCSMQDIECNPQAAWRPMSGWGSGSLLAAVANSFLGYSSECEDGTRRTLNQSYPSAFRRCGRIWARELRVL
eukprot:13405721-Heterocapsa_arctica.AAC.1